LYGAEMSSPSRVYFCENGHIAESYGHGEIGLDEGEKCSCGSPKLKVQVNWPINSVVPEEPIREVRCEHCNSLLERIYDVKELFNGNAVSDS
jgi:hypothetical protein